MKSIQHLLATTLLLISIQQSATAASTQNLSPEHKALAEKIIECKASIKEVVQFNQLVDQKKIALRELEDKESPIGASMLSIWGFPEPVSALGRTTKYLSFQTRWSFLMLIQSPTPHKDLAKVASELKLDEDKSITEMANSYGRKDRQYQKASGDRTLQAMTPMHDNDKYYFVGCTYDEKAYLTAAKKR